MKGDKPRIGETLTQCSEGALAFVGAIGISEGLGCDRDPAIPAAFDHSLEKTAELEIAQRKVVSRSAAVIRLKKRRGSSAYWRSTSSI